jgi:hypothetical protein
MSDFTCFVCGRGAQPGLRIEWHEPAGRANSLRPRFAVCAGLDGCHDLLSEAQRLAGLLLSHRAARGEGDIVCATVVGVCQAFALQTLRSGSDAPTSAESWNLMASCWPRIFQILMPDLFAARPGGIVGPNPRANDRRRARSQRRAEVSVIAVTPEIQRAQVETMLDVTLDFASVLSASGGDEGSLAMLQGIYESRGVLVERVEQLERAGCLDAHRPLVEVIQRRFDHDAARLREARWQEEICKQLVDLAPLARLADVILPMLLAVAHSVDVGEADEITRRMLEDTVRILDA